MKYSTIQQESNNRISQSYFGTWQAKVHTLACGLEVLNQPRPWHVKAGTPLGQSNVDIGLMNSTSRSRHFHRSQFDNRIQHMRRVEFDMSLVSAICGIRLVAGVYSLQEIYSRKEQFPIGSGQLRLIDELCLPAGGYKSCQQLWGLKVKRAVAW